MDVGAAGGDERGLRNKEEDPRGEGGAVNMNNQTWQRRAKNAGQEIAARKADKDGDEHEQRHGGEEIVVVTAAGRAGDWADGLLRLSGNCGQDASVRTWTDVKCASTWELQALYTELVWGAPEESVRAEQLGRSEDRPLQLLADQGGSGLGGGLCAGLGHKFFGFGEGLGGGNFGAGFVYIVDVEGRVEEENCGAGFGAGALGLMDVL